MEGTIKTTGPPMHGGRGLVAALLFLLAGLVPTLFAVRALTARVDRQAEAILENDANHIAGTVAFGLDQYIEVLYGARGLFVGSLFVSRKEWKEFFDVQDFPERLPGVRTLQFTERVTQDQYETFIQSVRADTSRDPAGYPSFRIVPPGSRAEYYVINYVEPMEANLPSFGFDALSDAVQKAVIGRVRDEATPIIAVVSGPKTDEPELTLFLPLYRGLTTPDTVNARRAAIKGLMSLTLDQEVMFADMLAGSGERGGILLDIEVHDGSRFDPESGSSLLFHRPGDFPGGKEAARVRTDTVSFGGSEMVLVIRADTRYGRDATDTYLPVLAAIFGTALPIAAFAVFLALNRSRQAALQLATGATRELREKAKELAESNRRLEGDVESRTAALGQKVSELEGSKTAILNVLDDLTLAKTEVESGQAYDQALLASIADGVIAIDTQGRITEVNEAALRLLKRTREELAGKLYIHIVKMTDEDGASVPAEQRPFIRALTGAIGQVFVDSEHYFERGDGGERFPVTIEASAIVLGGRVQGAIGVFRDTTKEKEIDRAKSEFVSLASHQLRTPLTSIGWYTELLLTEGDVNLTPQQRAHLAEITTANKRMVDLVDALLNVSRLELGTMTLNSEQTPVKELVRRVVAQFSVQIAEKKLRVDEQYPDEDIVFMTDPRMLAVVVENLLSNAVKYSPPEKPITIKAGVEGGMFVLSVADNGIGIPQAQQPKMFTKLFRADNARLSDTDGNGLGLYLAKSIIDRMAGSITFSSKEGQGSIFTIRVPIAGPPPNAPAPAGGGLEGKK